jgi:hypothetical protein
MSDSDENKTVTISFTVLDDLRHMTNYDPDTYDDREPLLPYIKRITMLLIMLINIT